MIFNAIVIIVCICSAGKNIYLAFNSVKRYTDIRTSSLSLVELEKAPSLVVSVPHKKHNVAAEHLRNIKKTFPLMRYNDAVKYAMAMVMQDRTHNHQYQLARFSAFASASARFAADSKRGNEERKARNLEKMHSEDLFILYVFLKGILSLFVLIMGSVVVYNTFNVFMPPVKSSEYSRCMRESHFGVMSAIFSSQTICSWMSQAKSTSWYMYLFVYVGMYSYISRSLGNLFAEFVMIGIILSMIYNHDCSIGVVDAACVVSPFVVVLGTYCACYMHCRQMYRAARDNVQFNYICMDDFIQRNYMAVLYSVILVFLMSIVLLKSTHAIMLSCFIL